MLIWSLISFIGVWFVHRTSIEIEILKITSSSNIEWARNFGFFVIILGNFYLRNDFFPLILINSVLVSAPIFLPLLISRFRNARARNSILPTLDSLVLSMRSGKSFRLSLSESLENSDLYLRKLLEEFISSANYQKIPAKWCLDPELNAFFNELWNVDRSNAKQIDLLGAYRRKLTLIKNFRQKSRQALIQTRAQSMISAAIYCLVLLYVQFEFGLRKHAFLAFISMTLFAIGFLITMKMGRNYRWKI